MNVIYIYVCIYVYVYVFSLVFLSLKLYVYGMILQIETCIHGVIRVCWDRTWVLVMKGAPPRSYPREKKLSKNF